MRPGEPAVSIIIPCYNVDRFLAETLESVFAQTFADYELIVVDDGSTDSTASVIRSFGSKVKAIFGPNRGASLARNTGTEYARGEFIQYLDADDLLAPNALENRVKKLLSTGADVAYSDWQKLEESETGRFLLGETVARRIDDIHSDPEIALFTNFWAPPAALLYRRSIVEAIGGWNISLPIIQDARYALDAALRGGRFAHVPGVGAYYRISRQSSLSRRDPLAFVQDVFLNACQVEGWWEKNEGLTDERRAALAQVYNYTARTLFIGNSAMFRDSLRRLYKVMPGFQFTWPKIAGVLKSILGRRGAAYLLRLLRPQTWPE